MHSNIVYIRNIVVGIDDGIDIDNIKDDIEDNEVSDIDWWCVWYLQYWYWQFWYRK